MSISPLLVAFLEEVKVLLEIMRLFVDFQLFTCGPRMYKGGLVSIDCLLRSTMDRVFCRVLYLLCGFYAYMLRGNPSYHVQLMKVSRFQAAC